MSIVIKKTKGKTMVYFTCRECGEITAIEHENDDLRLFENNHAGNIYCQKCKKVVE